MQHSNSSQPPYYVPTVLCPLLLRNDSVRHTARCSRAPKWLLKPRSALRRNGGGRQARRAVLALPKSGASSRREGRKSGHDDGTHHDPRSPLHNNPATPELLMQCWQAPRRA
eukprot:2248962-Pyramimonas_sp.AAC.1